MAKKKTSPRRVPHSATPRTFGDGLPSAAASASAEAAAETTRPAGRPAPVVPAVRRPMPIRSGEARAQAPLSEEYRYIGKDLRRLAMLAVVTFALMIALGLVIR